MSRSWKLGVEGAFKGQEKEEKKAVPYQEAVVSLMHVMVMTRPNIAFAVGQVAQYAQKSEKQHWLAVKRILAYLIKTKIFGLHFGKTSISLIGSVWNVNRWRSVKFDVCLDVWHEPNFGLTFDGDVWRSTLRISNVVELNTRRNFLYILHGVFIIVIEFCWYSANWFPIPKLFQTQVFFKFFKLTREVLNFVKKFWRWTSYLMLRKFYVTLTFFWRLTYCFFVDGDVLPERQTSWNLIDVPNTAYWLLWRRLCWWLANTSFNFQICVPSSWRACLLGQSTSTMCSTLHYWSWIRWCCWFGQRSCLVSTTAVRARNWLAPDYHILW